MLPFIYICIYIYVYIKTKNISMTKKIMHKIKIYRPTKSLQWTKINVFKSQSIFRVHKKNTDTPTI